MTKFMHYVWRDGEEKAASKNEGWRGEGREGWREVEWKLVAIKGDVIKK